MGLVKKLKDILFEEEEEITEPLKINDTPKEEPKIVKIESLKDDEAEEKEEVKSIKKELEETQEDNSFKFPDFDEDEFVNSFSKEKPRANVLDFERKKTIEKRTDYGRYEKVEQRDYQDRKKFKPSPIISPVYGILNQDYKAEDIVNKSDIASNISIEEVRKKAFEPRKEIKEEVKKEVIDEPVVTFFEEKDNANYNDKDEYKSIDDLLEEASTEIPLEDTLEMPKTNNIDEIESELERLDSEVKEEVKDDTLDNDLFELIDSMYDEKEDD